MHAKVAKLYSMPTPIYEILKKHSPNTITASMVLRKHICFKNKQQYPAWSLTGCTDKRHFISTIGKFYSGEENGRI